MMEEVREAFSHVGLDIGAEKTHWTAHPANEGDDLQFQGINVVGNQL